MNTVSELADYVFCPRKAYLQIQYGRDEFNTPETRIQQEKKKINRRLTAAMRPTLEENNPEEVEMRLLGILESLSAGADPGMVATLAAEVRVFSREWAAMVDEMGQEKALEYAVPKYVDVHVKSTSLGLSGRIDKILCHDSPAPVDIRPASKLVWDSDRVKLCAYGILLEERESSTVPHGYLETGFCHELKPVVFDGRLREKFHEALVGLRKLADSDIPELMCHGEPRRCEACPANEKCYTT